MITPISRTAGLALCAFAVTVVGLAPPAAALERPALTGLNVAGGEFGKLGGRHGYDYIYPSDADLDFTAANGFDTVRMPFLWERLQPQLGQSFDEKELRLIRDAVRRAEARKLVVILDPHDYARYRDKVIGSPDVPIEAFAAFWRTLAKAFADDRQVVFGLMNEPHDMSSEVWASASQAAIDAIRATGASNLVLVPGNAYSGAHSWYADGYGTPNAVAMATVSDPCGNMAFEFHQYFDEDASGSQAACRPAGDVVVGLSRATAWLKETKNRGFLGEFGGSEQPACLAGLDGVLRHLDKNRDVWVGWTYWAAGSWWPKDYPLSIMPRGKVARPQMNVLRDHLGRLAADTLSTTCRPSKAP